MLHALDLKSQVVAYDLLKNLLRAAEQLESRARNCLQVAQIVQLEVDPDSSSTSWSILGVCCTFAHPGRSLTDGRQERMQIIPLRLPLPLLVYYVPAVIFHPPSSLNPFRSTENSLTCQTHVSL